MTVPIKPHLLALLFNDAFNKTYNSARAIWRGVSYCIAHANCARAAANCGRVERTDGFRFRSRRIFGDVHHRHTLANGKRNGVFGHLQ